MAKDHGPSIKNDKVYEKLREEGYSKEKAARIANTPQEQAAKKGGKHPPYEEWTKAELYDKAQEVEINGRSTMNKDELIVALREH